MSVMLNAQVHNIYPFCVHRRIVFQAPRCVALSSPPLRVTSFPPPPATRQFFPSPPHFCVFHLKYRRLAPLG